MHSRVAGLISNEHIRKDTSMWCEGRPEWQPLQHIQELAPLVQVAAEVAAAVKKR